MALGWTVVHGGKTPPPGSAVAPNERLSWGRTVGLGAQHVVAMFGATFVFPVIMGLNAQLAILMSGVATIAFLLIVQGKVPSYLGTSAAFVGGVAAIRAQGGDSSDVTGVVAVSAEVRAVVRGPEGEVDCTVSAGACVLVARGGRGGTSSNAVPLTFGPAQ